MTKVVSVNERGVLTLPKEVREKLGVIRGGQILVETDENGMVYLQAGLVMPVEIYSTAREKEFYEVNEAPLRGKKLRWRKVR